MALDNQFGKGIGVAAGFDLGAQKPLDARVAVNTIAERDAHVENNRAYEGMLVYVAEANMTYQLVKGEEEGQLVWKEFGFNQNDFDESFAGAIQDVDDRLKAVEEDLAQGGEIEARIAQAESDIDGLQGLVGQPAQAGEGEEEGVPATGLHLALDNAKAELEQDILDEKGRAEGQEAAIRQELADEAAEIRGEMAAELGNYTVEAGEGVEGKEASGLRKEIEDAHKAMDQAMAQAHQEMNQAMEGAVAGEKERAEGQEAAIRGEMAAEATRVNQKIADDIAAESALRVAEEQRIEKALEDEAAAIRGEMAEQHQAMNKAAEEAHQAIDKAMEDEAARVDKKIADDIAAESALRVAEEQRIAGLVNAEAQRADAEEKRIVGLVETEKGRAEAAELKLTQDLAKEVEDRGKAVQELSDKHDQEMEAAAEQVGKDLAALKAELQGEIDADVAAEAKLREAADKALDENVIKPLQAHVAAQPGVDAEQDRRIKALEDDAPVKQAAIEAAQAAADQAQSEVDVVEGRALALEGRAEALEEDVARLDGAVDVEGSVKKQIKDAIDAVNTAAGNLEDRVEANEAKLAGLTNATVKAEIEAAQAAAEKHADDAITALVDSAPDAMNTLNELAKAINDNKGIYDAYIEEHNTAMNNLKSDLQKEIDADVKVVADELAKQKDAAQEGTLANKIKAEATRADAAEKANKAAIDELIETVGHDVIRGEIGEKIEDASGLVARILANETFVAAQPAIEQEQDRRLTELEAFKNAMGAESVGLDKRIDALELFVNGKEAAEGVAAVKSVDQKIADAEAAAKNHAETQDTALHATIKAEMAAVIQSLAVGIVDGKLRVALGGIEGDDVLVIREQKIDFVTDAEIDAIIAGLDEEDTPAE